MRTISIWDEQAGVAAALQSSEKPLTGCLEAMTAETEAVQDETPLLPNITNGYPSPAP